MIKTHKEYFKIFLLWVPLVSIGSLVGLSLGRFLTKNFGDRDFGLTLFIALILVGLFIGLGQWIVINSRLKKVWYWTPATAIGFSFGSFISYFIVSIIGRSLLHRYYEVYQWIEMPATLMAAGMFTGALQWLALKRRLAESIKWLLVSGLSLTLGFVALNFIDESPLAYVGSSIFGLTVGLLTGVFAEPLILRPEFKDL